MVSMVKHTGKHRDDDATPDTQPDLYMSATTVTYPWSISSHLWVNVPIAEYSTGPRHALSTIPASVIAAWSVSA